MARGFVSGVVWGLVVSGAGVAGASLLAGGESRVVLAPMAEPEKPVVETPVVAPEVAEPEMQTPEAVAEPEPEAATPDPVIVPELIAPEPEIPAEEPQTAPVDTTQDDATDGAPEATMSNEPQAPAADPVEEVEPAAPVEEQAEAAAPQTPVVEAEETVEPVTPVVTTPAEPEAVEPETPVMAQPVETPASEDPAPAPEMSEAMAEDAASVVTPQEDPAPEVVEEDVVEPAVPETDTAEPRIAALPQITAPEPSDEAATEPQAETPEADAAPEAETTGANTRRLPTIGGAAEPETDEPAASDQADADQATDGALTRFAMPFENPDAKPMLSVVLIDNPNAPVSDEVLANLPFPLGFAIDATRDDANEAAARYRAAGFEVLLVTNLPKGASASDVAVAFEAYMNAIPEAVAVLDRDATSAEAQQIAGILADRGLGLVTPSKGLNSAQKAAQREGVPAALVFRELDAGNEEVSAIRQYLDRAAFRAAQEGSVVMLGHTRPETIQALVLWALEGRAASVAIAPVSAVLKGG